MNPPSSSQTTEDKRLLEKAVQVALESEKSGNLPIGAIITLDGEIISKGYNAVQHPDYHPGRHAEIEALRNVPTHLWPQSRRMNCYTTLEPCIMCFGSLILHKVRRIVFGANDPAGGATYLLDHLPEYYENHDKPEFSGPLMPETCNPLYQRAADKFEKLHNI